MEQNIEIRLELLKLLGVLGAIDSFQYKKVTVRMKEALGYHTRFYTYEEIL